MASNEGGGRGEWIGKEGYYWVYWKRPEEWGDVVLKWVDATGQKGMVLTFYELLNGEGTVGEGTQGIGFYSQLGIWGADTTLDFHDMDTELFAKAMNVLVKRGKAQVFGDEDSRGLKFF